MTDYTPAPMQSLLILGQAAQMQSSYGPMFMLSLFIAASVWIGIQANNATSSGGFMKGFFLGNHSHDDIFCRSY